MDILAYLWSLYGQVVLELVAFGCMEVVAYYAFLRYIEKRMPTRSVLR